MFRIGLFLLTNLGVLLVASAAFKILGIEQFLARQGMYSNLTGLLLFCALFGFGGAFISLLLSKTLAKRGTGTRLIEQPQTPQERWLLDTVAHLSQQAGISMPEVGIFPDQRANAFATGWNKNAALVAVSAGLLSRFREDEARAVLAHEIGHVANGDMVTLSLIQGVVNTFVMFFARIIGQLVDRVVFKNERGHGIGFFVATFVAEMVLGILASMIVMWFSRFREYRADAAGAQLAGRGAMIGALQRLQLETQAGAAGELPDEMTAFGINAGFKQGLMALLASHPPLARRIEALQHGR